MGEYLYHYTNLESLAMILKSQTIKLNPLTVMDDSQECMTKDVMDFGKYIFISSWIDEKRESIAMGKMYSNLYNGVRIKLRYNPFVQYNITKNDFESVFPQVKIKGTDANFIISFDEFINSKYFLINYLHDQVVERVVYSDDKADIYPQILNSTMNGTRIEYSILGKYKNTYWEFQNEVASY